MGWTARKSERTGRVLLGGLLVAWLAVPNSLSAQLPAGGPQFTTSPQAWLEPTGYASPEVGSARCCPQVGSGPWFADPQALQLRRPDLYGTPQTAVPGVGYLGPDGIVTRRVAEHDDWQESTPFEQFVKKTLRNGWMRLEWLQWEIEAPGNKLLGTRTLSNDNPRDFFDIFIDGDPPIFGIARVPDLRFITFKDIDGIRGTFGFPFTFAEFEASVFALEQGSDVERPGIVLPNVLVAQTTTFNGELTDNTFLFYDQSFVARYTNDIWGAEAILVLNTDQHVAGVNVDPIVGVQYLNVQEQLEQVGRASGDLFVRIDSKTDNHVYGAKLGVRAELVNHRFVLGVEPSVVLGLNTYEARVTNEQNLTTISPKLVTESNETTFSPIGEVSVYARVRLRDNFFLTVGYDLMAAFRVTRPHDNIVYDINAVDDEPVSSNVHVNEDVDRLILQGLTVGGEIIFH